MSELHRRLLAALERPHRLGMIGGDLEEQLAHCASFSSVLAGLHQSRGPGARALDLGTGGGLPGIALAALAPDSAWTLLDQRSGRTAEVERAVVALDLDDVTSVVTGQAQELAHTAEHRESYDTIVARAFGPTSLTAECAAGFLRVGGVLVVSEPPGRTDDERWPPGPLAALGFGPAAYCSRSSAATVHHFALLTKAEPADARFPRLPPRPTRGWIRTD